MAYSSLGLQAKARLIGNKQSLPLPLPLLMEGHRGECQGLLGAIEYHSQDAHAQTKPLTTFLVHLGAQDIVRQISKWLRTLLGKNP